MKLAMLATLFMVFISVQAARAGEVIIRETETGVYVELTGEKTEPVKTQEEIAAERQAAAQEAADKASIMQRYAKQKARLEAKRLKMPQEEEEADQ